MTGWLSVLGVALVLIASLYAGISSTDAGEGDSRPAAQLPRVMSTPLITQPEDEAERTQPQQPAGEQATAGEQGAAEGQPQSVPEPATTPVANAEINQSTTAGIQVTNRQDCNKIRGTNYNSPEERTWFLTNCVR